MTANPLFAPPHQDRIGTYPAPGPDVGGRCAHHCDRRRPSAPTTPRYRPNGWDMTAVCSPACWTLAPVGDDTFRGAGNGPVGKRAYGGHLAAQAMLAACHTVDAERVPTAPARPVPARRGRRGTGGLSGSRAFMTDGPRPPAGFWAGRAIGHGQRHRAVRRSGNRSAALDHAPAAGSVAVAEDRADRPGAGVAARRDRHPDPRRRQRDGVRPPALVACHPRRCPTIRACTPRLRCTSPTSTAWTWCWRVHGHSMTDRSHHAATTDSSIWFHANISA